MRGMSRFWTCRNAAWMGWATARRHPLVTSSGRIERYGISSFFSRWKRTFRLYHSSSRKACLNIHWFMTWRLAVVEINWKWRRLLHLFLFLVVSCMPIVNFVQIGILMLSRNVSCEVKLFFTFDPQWTSWILEKSFRSLFVVSSSLSMRSYVQNL